MTNIARNLAFSALVVSAILNSIAANAVENGVSPVCKAAQANSGPLLDSGDARACYFTELSGKLAALAGAGARERAGGFAVQFDAALKAPADKPRSFLYPQENSTNMLVIAAVVPPKGYESLPIPACAQQNNKVLGTWQITNKGEVLPVAWTGATTGEVVPGVGVKPACNAFIKAARADMARQTTEADSKESGQNSGLSAAPQPPN